MEMPKIQSIEEAERLKAELADMQVDIQTQLGDRDKHHPDGSRFTSNEYWQWRKKASFAMACGVKQLRFLKQWIKNYNKINGTHGGNPKAKKGLVIECEKAIDLFLSYKKQGLSDEDSKLAVLDEMTLRFGLIDLSESASA